MKKFLALILALSMVFALCGCAGSDYKKAVSLFEEGEYEQAKELFVALKDYEDSEEYVRKCVVLSDPVAAIEEVIKSEFDNDEAFWKSYNEYLNMAKSFGLASSGGKLVFDTKYDEQSKEFACMVDIPVMQGNTVYTHYYYGFFGHIDAPNVEIEGIDSIEFTESRVNTFWSNHWKH